MWFKERKTLQWHDGSRQGQGSIKEGRPAWRLIRGKQGSEWRREGCEPRYEQLHHNWPKIQTDPVYSPSAGMERSSEQRKGFSYLLSVYPERKWDHSKNDKQSLSALSSMKEQPSVHTLCGRLERSWLTARPFAVKLPRAWNIKALDKSSGEIPPPV